MLLILLVCVCSHLALIRLLVSERRGLTQVANIIVAEGNTSAACRLLSIADENAQLIVMTVLKYDVL